MAKTKDMPSNVIKAGAELSKVVPGPQILQASCPVDARGSEPLDQNYVTRTLGSLQTGLDKKS